MRLSDAVTLLQVGALADAEHVCATILKREKRNADAMTLLAHVYGRLGRGSESVDLLKRALKIRPDDLGATYNLGVACNLIEDHEGAIQAYRVVLASAPHHLDACLNLGLSLFAVGHATEALLHLRHAHQLASRRSDIALNFASALIDVEQFSEALQILDRADPSRADAAALVLRAKALNGLKQNAAALETATAALRNAPQMTDAHISVGVSLLGLQRPKEALASFNRAIEGDARSFFAHHNRGEALHELGLLDEAGASYDRAHQLQPENADPLFNKSLTLLLGSEFDAGWPLYENRKKRTKIPLGVHRTGLPALTSLELARGAHVFVDFEQGLGDTIQFCRFAKLLADSAACVTLRVQDSMTRLVATLDPRLNVIGASDPAPQADFHVQTMSLPLLYGTNATNIPYAAGYLAAESDRVTRWRETIGEHGFKVAIAWQGNHQAKVDLGRSFDLAHYGSLSSISGLRLISLQKSEGSEQLDVVPPGMNVETLGVDFDGGPHAFLDSAAVISCADLVITSDTALAHLAGALGKPVWVALKHVPDWRWMLTRADSPWYASMRLFRQPAPGDWAAVFADMAALVTQQSS